MDAELKTLMGMLLECQARTERSINELAAQVGRSHELLEAADSRLEASHRRTEEAIGDLAVRTAKYIKAADARMRRVEENLDGLIRAITREHSNGKGQ